MTLELLHHKHIQAHPNGLPYNAFCERTWVAPRCSTCGRKRGCPVDQFQSGGWIRFQGGGIRGRDPGTGGQQERTEAKQSLAYQWSAFRLCPRSPMQIDPKPRDELGDERATGRKRGRHRARLRPETRFTADILDALQPAWGTSGLPGHQSLEQFTGLARRPHSGQFPGRRSALTREQRYTTVPAAGDRRTEER